MGHFKLIISISIICLCAGCGQGKLEKENLQLKAGLEKVQSDNTNCRSQIDKLTGENFLLKSEITNSQQLTSALKATNAVDGETIKSKEKTIREKCFDNITLSLNSLIDGLKRISTSPEETHNSETRKGEKDKIKQSIASTSWVIRLDIIELQDNGVTAHDIQKLKDTTEDFISNFATSVDDIFWGLDLAAAGNGSEGQTVLEGLPKRADSLIQDLRMVQDIKNDAQ